MLCGRSFRLALSQMFTLYKPERRMVKDMRADLTSRLMICHQPFS